MVLEMVVEIPLLIPQRRELIVATHPESLPEVAPSWPCGLSPVALQGLPGFRGSYETPPGIVETEVIQNI